MRPQKPNVNRHTHTMRGISLVLLTTGMVVVLGSAAMGIDMVSFYMARNAAQRAADAAALAGASVFASSGCTANTTTPCSSTTIESAAKAEAETVGNQNLVGNVSPDILSSDISFTTTNAGNPQVTVNVSLTSAHGNPVPTFFGKIFGFSTVNVSVAATAEVYNPASAGSGMPGICLSCMKPIAVPNCDPGHTSPRNTNCTGGTMATFVNPPGSSNPGQISNPGVYPHGVIGEAWLLETGTSSTKNSPSDQYFYMLNFGSGTSAYAGNVTSCNSMQTGCGDSWATLNPTSVGATNFEDDWMNLINQTTICEVGGTDLKQSPGGNNNEENPNGGGNSGISQLPMGNQLPITSIAGHKHMLNPPCGDTGGQDTISGTTAPFTITGGANNQNSNFVGENITNSISIVTVPIYNGATITPGSASVTIVGFMQGFVTEVCDETSGGDLTFVILNITGCPSSGSSGCSSLNYGGGGSGGTSSTLISGGGASVLPVRLVRGSSGT